MNVRAICPHCGEEFDLPLKDATEEVVLWRRELERNTGWLPIVERRTRVEVGS